jgi:hypothetical protein
MTEIARLHSRPWTHADDEKLSSRAFRSKLESDRTQTGSHDIRRWFAGKTAKYHPEKSDDQTLADGLTAKK